MVVRNGHRARKYLLREVVVSRLHSRSARRRGGYVWQVELARYRVKDIDPCGRITGRIRAYSLEYGVVNMPAIRRHRKCM